MSFLKRSRVSAVVAVVLVAGCHHKGGFQPLKYPSHQALYDASLGELRKHKWGHAVTGFEKLTTDLPARDPLLPESYYYLGDAHMGSHEYILAAQSYSRVAENFPEDTLADRATYKTGVAYSKLWRRPGLDRGRGGAWRPASLDHSMHRAQPVDRHIVVQPVTSRSAGRYDDAIASLPRPDHQRRKTRQFGELGQAEVV